MANMVSLKRTPTERKKDSDILSPSDGSFFPLTLHISDTEVDKLGLSQAQVGEKMMLTAEVKVTSVSASEREGSNKREHVTLTLMQGSVHKAGKRTADVLFGDK